MARETNVVLCCFGLEKTVMVDATFVLLICVNIGWWFHCNNCALNPQSPPQFEPKFKLFCTGNRVLGLKV